MSKYNWPDLIDSYQASALSQTEFCKEKNINPKYFNLKYSQHRSKQDDTSTFVKAQIESAVQVPTLTLHVGRCTVRCPHNMPIQSFVSLVHQLA